MSINRALAIAVCVGAWLGVAACARGHGASTDTDAQAPDDAGPGVSADTGRDGATDAQETDGGSDAASSCATGAELVYVASEERNLYSFDPKAATFMLLGNIDCAQGGYVNSMAIDRDANAWINYSDGSLWKVGTQHPVCTATGFKPNQQGVGLFGMGFAAKTAGGTQDILFIDDLMGGGLGFIDLATMTLMRLGPFIGPLANGDCELTGTADAKLYGFFAGSPLGDAGSSSVAQIDPNTEGPLMQWPLPSVDTGSDWAFATWGGDFYLFTADKYNMLDPFTTVTRFSPSDPGDGGVSVLAQNIGFRVVGAGASTCAPTTAQ